MNRVAIIIDQSLSNGEVANASAILMGQMVKDHMDIYSSNDIIDKSGFKHSGIKCNTVILKSSRTKLMKFCTFLQKYEKLDEIRLSVFCEKGKLLNNQFNEYAAVVTSNFLLDLIPISIILAGEDSIIRNLTKQFSLY